MTDKINAMAREEFWRLANEARERGLDLAEVLDRQGYLLTPRRLARIQADTLAEVAELFETTMPHQYTHKNTQNDLMRVLAQFVRGMELERRR
jgi:hypothetical protein